MPKSKAMLPPPISRVPLSAFQMRLLLQLKMALFNSFESPLA